VYNQQNAAAWEIPLTLAFSHDMNFPSFTHCYRQATDKDEIMYMSFDFSSGCTSFRFSSRKNITVVSIHSDIA